MSSHSEQVLGKIIEIASRDEINLFEASVTYCEESGIEPEDLAAHLDRAALDQIKVAAVEGRHVRQVAYKLPKNTLFS